MDSDNDYAIACFYSINAILTPYQIFLPGKRP